MSTNITIRWMIRADMPSVLEIERQSFADPWDESDFVAALRQRSTIGRVAIDEHGTVLGFVLYELNKRDLAIANLVIHPDHRRNGIGRAFVERLAGKLSVCRRSSILVDVFERNLSAQLFFRAMGFKAVAIVRGQYIDADSNPVDAYVMEFRHPSDVPVNRIERWPEVLNQ